ncbi:hypothetical protein QUF64_15150 [Anaerolineales bacterium HSG6]|nr:hypothetical protein [Anaerolineales bacterium HSG6]
MRTQPHCSSCKVTGKQHIIIEPLNEKVLLVYCRRCGSIHGVLPSLTSSDTKLDLSIISDEDTRPKVSQKEEETDFKPYLVKPKPKVKQNDKFVHHVSFTTTDLAKILSLVLSEKVILSDYQASQVYFDADNKANISNTCPQCQTKMIKLMVPDQLPHAREFFWICSNYQTCQQWVSQNGTIQTFEKQPLEKKPPLIDMPIPSSNCPKCHQELRNMRIPKGHKGAGRKVWVCASCQYWRYDSTVGQSTSSDYHPVVILIGHADLAQRRVDYERKINARMAMGRGNTNYVQVAMDDGPPYCENCKVDMVKSTVPPDLPNSGKVVWFCPQRCGNWEANKI